MTYEVTGGRQMTDKEFAAWQADAAERYAADVRKAAKKLPKLTAAERAVIGAVFPGYVKKENIQTLSDVRVNRVAIKQARKIIKALGYERLERVQELHATWAEKMNETRGDEQWIALDEFLDELGQALG